MDTLPIADTLPVLIAQPPIQVVARKSIFRDNSVREHFAVPHGATLLDIAIESKMAEWQDGKVRLPGNVAITIDGDLIERRYWHRVRPRGGRIVNAYLVPANQRQGILIGAAIIIAVASVLTYGAAGAAGYPVLGALGAATISLGGRYELDSFLP